jgi:hypothetical protein
METSLSLSFSLSLSLSLILSLWQEDSHNNSDTLCLRGTNTHKVFSYPPPPHTHKYPSPHTFKKYLTHFAIEGQTHLKSKHDSSGTTSQKYTKLNHQFYTKLNPNMIAAALLLKRRLYVWRRYIILTLLNYRGYRLLNSRLYVW